MKKIRFISVLSPFIFLALLISCGKDDDDPPTSGGDGNTDCDYIQSTETGNCSTGLHPIFPGLCCPEQSPFSTEDCDVCYASCEAAAANCDGPVYRANIPGGGGNQGFSYDACNQADPYDLVIDTDEPLYEGILCITNVRDDENGLNVQLIEYQYSMNTFFGEPLERAYISWSGSTGSSDFNMITVRAEVFNAEGDFTGWYHFKSPLVTDSPETWSWDVSGSPDWNEFFSNIDDSQNASESVTQDLFENGFYLDNFVPMSINGVDYQ